MFPTKDEEKYLKISLISEKYICIIGGIKDSEEPT